MPLDAAQRGVLRNMLAGLAIAILVLAAAICWQPAWATPLAQPVQRLIFTLQWDAIPLLCLVVAIASLARHRFLTPADIHGSGLTRGTDRAQVLQAVIQNTLEQAVVAVLAHLVWTAAMPRGWLAAIPAAALLFLAGRILFALGYARGAPARALGFALTFYPTVILALVATGTILWQAIAGDGGAGG